MNYARQTERAAFLCLICLSDIYHGLTLLDLYVGAYIFVRSGEDAAPPPACERCVASKAKTPFVTAPSPVYPPPHYERITLLYVSSYINYPSTKYLPPLLLFTHNITHQSVPRPSSTDVARTVPRNREASVRLEHPRDLPLGSLRGRARVHPEQPGPARGRRGGQG